MVRDLRSIVVRERGGGIIFTLTRRVHIFKTKGLRCPVFGPSNVRRSHSYDKKQYRDTPTIAGASKKPKSRGFDRRKVFHWIKNQEYGF
jgi:hypothetical protein